MFVKMDISNYTLFFMQNRHATLFYIYMYVVPTETKCYINSHIK